MRRTLLSIAVAALTVVPVFAQRGRQSAEREGGNLALTEMVRAEPLIHVALEMVAPSYSGPRIEAMP